VFGSLAFDDLAFLVRTATVTVGLSGFAMVCGTILALFLALASMSKYAPAKYLAWGYIQLVRGSPLLMQIFFMFFGLPAVGIDVSMFGAAAGALTLNTAAFMSEIIRAGVQSIKRTQWEAAEALGLTRYQSLRHVIFPQAIRVMIPPSIGYATALIKNSSLASTIGFIEMTRAARIITERTGKGLVVFSVAGLMYFLLCYPLSQLARHMERRLSLRK